MGVPARSNKLGALFRNKYRGYTISEESTCQSSDAVFASSPVSQAMEAFLSKPSRRSLPLVVVFRAKTQNKKEQKILCCSTSEWSPPRLREQHVWGGPHPHLGLQGNQMHKRMRLWNALHSKAYPCLATLGVTVAFLQQYQRKSVMDLRHQAFTRKVTFLVSEWFLADAALPALDSAHGANAAPCSHLQPQV